MDLNVDTNDVVLSFQKQIADMSKLLAIANARVAKLTRENKALQEELDAKG